ncbi:MAG: SH3 domain-containing protein [Pseudomonadota bacterium]
MVRFILVSFAFLAFAFYEMSGGADFDAEALRQSRVDAPPVVETSDLEPTQTAQAPRLDPENVTRVSLSLTNVNDVLRPTTLRTTPAKVTATVAAKADEPLSEEEPVIILPSLIVDRTVIKPVDFNNNTEAQKVVAVSTGGLDVRSVSGNSVNVRGGPGTNYSVVDRMVRGDKVEILQDPGTGWVQLRPVGGGTVGWMADFLLNDG